MENTIKNILHLYNYERFNFYKKNSNFFDRIILWNFYILTICTLFYCCVFVSIDLILRNFWIHGFVISIYYGIGTTAFLYYYDSFNDNETILESESDINNFKYTPTLFVYLQTFPCIFMVLYFILHGYNISNFPWIYVCELILYYVYIIIIAFFHMRYIDNSSKVNDFLDNLKKHVAHENEIWRIEDKYYQVIYDRKEKIKKERRKFIEQNINNLPDEEIVKSILNDFVVDP